MTSVSNVRMMFTCRRQTTSLDGELIRSNEGRTKNNTPQFLRQAADYVECHSRTAVKQRETSLARRQRRQDVLGGLARRHSGASLFDPTPNGQSHSCNPITTGRGLGTFTEGVNALCST